MNIGQPLEGFRSIFLLAVRSLEIVLIASWSKGSSKKSNMAENGNRSREEIQIDIRNQGEIVRKLKQKEQSDEVKEQVYIEFSATYMTLNLFCGFRSLAYIGPIQQVLSVLFIILAIIVETVCKGKDLGIG